MVIVLQTAYLSWDLTSPVTYKAGEELECAISFTAPEDGTYYLMGALYTTNLEYIPGTIFGILLPEDADYAVNSTQYTSIWEMEAEEEKELPCKFTFSRTDVVLGLFLMKMAGVEPSLEDDEQIGAVSTTLSSGVIRIVDISTMMTGLIMVAMIGMIIPMALRD